MSGIAKHELVVLWAHEIRIASKAVADAFVALEKFTAEETPENAAAMNLAITNALNACSVALHNADNEASSLILASSPEVKTTRSQRPRRRA